MPDGVRALGERHARLAAATAASRSVVITIPDAISNGAAPAAAKR